MSKRQFSEVDCKYGAPMGRSSYGSIPECFPRSVRLFRVNLDSQGYDDGGAYWGIGQPLWCAIGEHDTWCQSRAFTRAGSREESIAELKIECGLLKHGPNNYRLNTLLGAAALGNDNAQALCDSLRDLGYTIYGFGYKTNA